MSQAYIVAFVLSKTCGHCVNFKNKHYNHVLSQIRDLNANIETLSIEVDNNAQKIPSRYPEALSNVIKWYPNILLFPKDLLASGRLKEKDIHIFNGKYLTEGEEGGPGAVHEARYMYNDKDVILWIKSVLGLNSTIDQEIKNLLPPPEAKLKMNFCANRKGYGTRRC